MASRESSTRLETQVTPERVSRDSEIRLRKPDGEQELSPEERARRKKIGETFKTAVQLDRDFFTRIKHHSEDLHETVDTIEALESLTFGGELDREDLGDVSMNGVSRRIYDGEPERVAYVKPQSSETFLALDPQTGQAVHVQRSRDPQTGALNQQFVAPHEQDVANLTSTLELQPAVCSEIADAYGVSVDELPVRPDAISNRISVPTESNAIREYTVSRINELVNFGFVPLTTLRKEENNTDLASVQEAVPSADANKPARIMNVDDYNELLAYGPGHKGAKSFMRIASLHYLVQALDGHDQNTMYDETAHKFYSIDNAMSFPLQKRVDATDATKDRYADPVVSLPIEVVEKYPDWELDADALGELQKLHGALVKYMSERPARKAAKEKLEGNQNPFVQERYYTADSEAAGKEAKYLTSLFRFQFGNEAIARREVEEFAKRLTTLIELKRPPKLAQDAQIRIADRAFPETP